MPKISIAVLASGRGSNFQAIIDGINSKEIDGEIKVLITDNPEAKAIERAKKNNIPVEIVERKKFEKRIEMDWKIKEILDEHQVDLVVLAGYLRIIQDPKLLDAYRYRIINIHPSLLPKFKGSTHAQKDAFEAGEKVSGLSVHFVTSDVDGGPILYQKEVDISECKSADEVSEKILPFEHSSYVQIVANFAKGKYIIKGDKAKFESYD